MGSVGQFSKIAIPPPSFGEVSPESLWVGHINTWGTPSPRQVLGGFHNSFFVTYFEVLKGLFVDNVWVGLLGCGGIFHIFDILIIGMTKISRLDILNIKCILKLKFLAGLLGANRYR